ncbi:MAG: 2-hydroxyglutaryl-CoA dehydratase [Christensenellales bacterium]|jgi:predicted nucleotide-binding protein (sugar kinase/HSP70/actin superfamily)
MKYVEFTREMKRDYTILVPNMLPIHFELIIQVLRNSGYKAELLRTGGHKIADTGLKYCHNDACYPAILVIGQFIDAIQNGGYDPDKTALIMFQTGGGCRASNYIFLIRKALEKAGYGQVPVISLNLLGLEKHSGFRLTVPLVKQMIYGMIYGDMLLTLVNQTRPYEVIRGTARALADRYAQDIAAAMAREGVSRKKVKVMCRRMLEDFKAIPVKRVPKVKVGVVGEIYVKYSPLGNNNLNDFLVSEGAEVFMPGLLDFFMASSYCRITDYKLLGMRKFEYPIQKMALQFMLNRQRDLIDLIEAQGYFQPPTPFLRTVSLIEGYISPGVEMGEGWLLPAEMLELYESGVKNIVCAQPFGCLPNHIVGKGMMKPLKEKNPGMNIVAIDYDAGATVVNQENRIKLMLANAREALERETVREPREEETA